MLPVFRVLLLTTMATMLAFPAAHAGIKWVKAPTVTGAIDEAQAQADAEAALGPAIPDGTIANSDCILASRFGAASMLCTYDKIGYLVVKDGALWILVSSWNRS